MLKNNRRSLFNKFKNIAKNLVSFLSITICANAIAANFDCSGKLAEVEKLICENPNLSALDSSLEKAYLFALEDANYIERQSIIKEQKSWVDQQRNVCDTEKCLVSVYIPRIQTLSAIKYESVNAHYIFDQTAISSIKDNFQKTMDSTGIITGKLDECTHVIMLDNTQKNPVYGGICSMNANKREVMICDDTKIGRLTIKFEGLGIYGNALANFTSENCPAGG